MYLGSSSVVAVMAAPSGTAGSRSPGTTDHHEAQWSRRQQDCDRRHRWHYRSLAGRGTNGPQGEGELSAACVGVHA